MSQAHVSSIGVPAAAPQGLHLAPTGVSAAGFPQLSGLVGAGPAGGLSAAAMEAEHVQQLQALRDAHSQQNQAIMALLQPPLHPQQIARALSAAGPLWAAATAGLVGAAPQMPPQDGADPALGLGMRFPGL